MKRAIFFDECGSEIAIDCVGGETVEQLLTRYPEYQFRYWEDPDRYYTRGDYYDPVEDCCL